MRFDESIRACLTKYADFGGCASRSEFWWWYLFLFLASSATAIVRNKLCDLFWLAMLVPTVAVTTRRLHDTNRSGWWQLIELIPVLGLVVLIIWCAQSSVASSRFDASAPERA